MFHPIGIDNLVCNLSSNERMDEHLVLSLNKSWNIESFIRKSQSYLFGNVNIFDISGDYKEII